MKKQRLTYEQALELCRQGVEVHRHGWGSGYLVIKGDTVYIKLPTGSLTEPISWTDRNAKDWETFEEAWW